jgi:chromosome segregation ATPase
MRKNLKLLESRVSRVADRLQRLSAERDRLASELGTLRDRLEGAERTETRTSEELSSWQAERGEVIAGLQQALHELRSE